MVQTYSVSVNYATSNINANAGADYIASSGMINFSPGETSKTISVSIINDYFSASSSQNYRMTISNAQNVNTSLPMTINTSIADVNITNDDPTLALTGPGMVAENSGVATYTVTLTSIQTYSVSVNYSTLNINALAGTDYVATSGTFLFEPGENVKIISIPIIDDFIL